MEKTEHPDPAPPRAVPGEPSTCPGIDTHQLKRRERLPAHLTLSQGVTAYRGMGLIEGFRAGAVWDGTKLVVRYLGKTKGQAKMEQGGLRRNNHW